MRDRIHRPYGFDGSPPHLEAPSHQRPEPDDASFALGDDHEGAPERVLEVLPAEVLGRAFSRRATAERAAHEIEHLGLVVIPVGADRQIGGGGGILGHATSSV